METIQDSKFKIRERILLPFLLVAVVLAAVCTTLFILEEKSHTREEVNRAFISFENYTQVIVKKQTDKLSTAINILQWSHLPIKNALAANDRKSLLALSIPIYAQLKEKFNISHFYYHTTEGINFLRVHQAHRFGDDITKRATMRGAIQTGSLSSGIELGPLGTLTLRVVAPLRIDNKIIGYIELGEDIDRLMPDIASSLALDFSLLINKAHLNKPDWEAGLNVLNTDRNWLQLPDHVIASNTNKGYVKSLPYILNGNCRSAEDSNHFFTDSIFIECRVSDFIDAAGVAIGKTILVKNLSTKMASIYQTAFYIVITTTILLSLLFWFFSGFLGRIELKITQYQQDISRNSDQLKRLNEGTPLAVIEWNNDFLIQDWNHSAQRLFQYERDHVIGKNFIGLLFKSDPFSWEEKITDPTIQFFIAPNKTAHDNLIHCEWHVSRILSNTGTVLGGCAFVHDVTKAKTLEKLATRSVRILENTWNEIYTFDATSLKIMNASQGARVNLGYSSTELSQISFSDLILDFTNLDFESKVKPLLKGKKTLVTFETVLARKNKSTYPVEIRIQYSSIETPAVFFCIVQDISERTQHIAELEHKALYDQLTGLPNKTLIQDRLLHNMNTASRNSSLLAVFMIDLVKLREINDIMGYHNGDSVLLETAKRLRESRRSSDTVARLAGDEFILLMEITENKDVAYIAKELQSLFATPFNIDASQISIEAAIGVSIFPYHGDTASKLLQHASIATRASRNESAGFTIYDPESNPFTLHQLELYSQLKTAVENGLLSIYCQPQVDIKTKKTVSIEILARWQHDSEGLISPNTFIPMIEMSGLITPFTKWLTSEVIQQIKQWYDSGLRITTSINLSSRNLLDFDLAEHVENLLNKHDISPSLITLEVTESAIMAHPDTAEKVLRQIHSKGIALSIDDFGTGYSSLAYLKRLPVHELKIDQSFVFGISNDHNDLVIVKSTIEMAHNLGLITVAEGVETEEAFSMLSDLGCDIAQGYYISRPFPIEELSDWMENSNW